VISVRLALVGTKVEDGSSAIVADGVGKDVEVDIVALEVITSVESAGSAGSAARQRLSDGGEKRGVAFIGDVEADLAVSTVVAGARVRGDIGVVYEIGASVGVGGGVRARVGGIRLAVIPAAGTGQGRDEDDSWEPLSAQLRSAVVRVHKVQCSQGPSPVKSSV
jgi:hypothetical protein